MSRYLRVVYFLNSIYFDCAQTFSGCGGQELLSSCGAWASHCGGLSCREGQALGTQASVVVEHWLTCSVACRIFLAQGSNPCPLQKQVDSLRLN